MLLRRMPQAVCVAILTLVATSCGGSSNSSHHDARAYCANAKAFLIAQSKMPGEGEEATGPIKGYDAVVAASRKTAESAPNATLTSQWNDVTKFYQVTSTDPHHIFTQDELSAMTVAISDATDRCHLNFRGDASASAG